jgi:hypothetical protein
LAFNPHDHAHGHLHGILNDNMTIFGSDKGVNVEINNSKKSSKVWLKKVIFPFF